MTKQQALTLIDQVISQVSLSREAHLKLIEALQVLKQDGKGSDGNIQDS